MKSQRFAFLLLFVFVFQVTFPLFIQPLLGWRIYFIPPWDYFKYPETNHLITDIAVVDSGHTYYVRRNLSYFELHFFDFITSHRDKKHVAKELKKRFFYLSKTKEPLKFVQFRCDALDYIKFGYEKCTLAREELLE